MSAPHAGGQLKWALKPWEVQQYEFNFINHRSLVHGQCSLDGYQVTYFTQVKMSEKTSRFWLKRHMKKVLEENNRKQQVIEEKIRKLQIIKDQISAKIVIDNIIFVCYVSHIMPLHVLKSVESQSTTKESGLLCTNHCEVSREVNRNNNTEENQKFYAEQEIAQNAEIAQVISEEPQTSSFTSEETPSLIRLPFISSSLESGGTSIISSPVLTALYLGTTTSLPTPSLDSTPSLINPTPPTGGTSAGASSADNPNIYSLPVCMPLLPPRTGIGVQDSSPPPTASICSTGVYAITFSASSANVADNPDNPDLEFDRSGIVPDNPRKPALDLWAYIASRG